MRRPTRPMNRRPALRAGLVTLCLAVPAAPAAAQTRAVTLTEALRLAERSQPTVVGAAADVRSADARVRSAWGSFLPTVTANSSANDFFSEAEARVDPVTGELTPGGSSTQSVTVGVNASVDLFTGFRRGADLRAARAGRNAAEAALVDARFQQALATTNQFFDALAAGDLVRVREASVRRAEEQLKVAVARLRVGSATRSDSLRALVVLGNARLERLRAESDLATAEAGLARLVGEIGRVAASDDSAFYAVLPTPDTAALRAELEARSPQVREAAARATAARSTVSASRAAYWPTLTFSANTRWNGTDANDYSLLNQRQLSLGLRWELFNGFARELAVAQDEAASDFAEAEAADARRAAHAALTARLAELEAARGGLDITRTSVTAATEDLRVQRERYRVGVSTILDLVTSQEALTQAEVDAVTARFDYLRARARLEALLGRTL